MEIEAAAPEGLSLTYVIHALRERVAAWGGQRILPTLLVLLLHRRLGEIGRLVDGLLVRFRAGRLVPRAARGISTSGEAACATDLTAAPAVAAGDSAVRRPGVRAKRLWPTKFGWLVRIGAHEAAGLGAQLRHVLEQPEMVALLQASPQAGRLLLPLCRALAIESAVLRPGAAARPRPEPKERKPRVRRKRAKLDLGRIPLPRGMLSAARRQGYGKLW